MNSTSRRTALARLAALGLGASPLLAAAQGDAAAWPTRPIKLMVGFPPGGSTDGPVRVLAESAGRLLKQPIVIENKTGAGGTMPAVALQTAAPDGYTLGISSMGMYRLPYTTDNRWSPDADITHIVGLTGYAFGIAVPADSPYKSWADYVAAAKAKPGQITYATPGVATTNHLTMERISRAAGIQLNHIPYKGTAESMQALLAHQVDSAAETSGWAPYVKEGRMRLLVVWAPKRMASFPDVPTLRDVGIPIAETSPWGLIGPKGMPPAVVKRLHDALKQAMEEAPFKQALARYEMEPQYMGTADFQAFAGKTMKQQKEILDTLGLSKR